MIKPKSKCYYELDKLHSDLGILDLIVAGCHLFRSAIRSLRGFWVIALRVVVDPPTVFLMHIFNQLFDFTDVCFYQYFLNIGNFIWFHRFDFWPSTLLHPSLIHCNTTTQSKISQLNCLLFCKLLDRQIRPYFQTDLLRSLDDVVYHEHYVLIFDGYSKAKFLFLGGYLFQPKSTGSSRLHQNGVICKILDFFI